MLTDNIVPKEPATAVQCCQVLKKKKIKGVTRESKVQRCSQCTTYLGANEHSEQAI